VKRKRLLDSYALLAYLNKEDGFEKVRNVMANAQKSGFPVLMNELNVGESYYILYRKRGHEQADYSVNPITFSIENAVMSRPITFWTLFWQGYPFL